MQEFGSDSLPEFLVCPTSKSIVYRLVFSELRRNVFPTATSAKNPENSIDHLTVDTRGVPASRDVPPEEKLGLHSIHDLSNCGVTFGILLEHREK